MDSDLLRSVEMVQKEIKIWEIFFDPLQKELRIKEIEQKMAEPNFWDSTDKAAKN